eukprot:TRINITY_DN69685_c0_g1_i1.p1 TRINITY_DN69685_c0_g1~~TRINITY_DN69685_c0_g1_i1.p1  ORF type:complete len:430 (-),score=43.87 TRINITY_DN69685_c0_g1_i1:423-1712(-)
MTTRSASPRPTGPLIGPLIAQFQRLVLDELVVREQIKGWEVDVRQEIWQLIITAAHAITTRKSHQNDIHIPQCKQLLLIVRQCSEQPGEREYCLHFLVDNQAKILWCMGQEIDQELTLSVPVTSTNGRLLCKHYCHISLTFPHIPDQPVASTSFALNRFRQGVLQHLSLPFGKCQLLVSALAVDFGLRTTSSVCLSVSNIRLVPPTVNHSVFLDFVLPCSGRRWRTKDLSCNNADTVVIPTDSSLPPSLDLSICEEGIVNKLLLQNSLALEKMELFSGAYHKETFLSGAVEMRLQYFMVVAILVRPVCLGTGSFTLRLQVNGTSEYCDVAILPNNGVFVPEIAHLNVPIRDIKKRLSGLMVTILEPPNLFGITLWLTLGVSKDVAHSAGWLSFQMLPGLYKTRILPYHLLWIYQFVKRALSISFCCKIH